MGICVGGLENHSTKPRLSNSGNVSKQTSMMVAMGASVAVDCCFHPKGYTRIGSRDVYTLTHGSNVPLQGVFRSLHPLKNINKLLLKLARL